MPTQFATLEQAAFRRLNAVVEPAVRKGIGSLSLAPASMIVLETVGFKSGVKRRTPLLSFCLGRYRLISTARGKRSFWVKNLVKEANASFYLGGRVRHTQAVVIDGTLTESERLKLPWLLRPLAKTYNTIAKRGWVFVLLL